MLCLASILSSSQLGQCGDFKAHWEVDLGGGGCTVKEMLPKQVSQPTEPLRNTTARSCLLCLYAQVSFLLQHKCSLWLCRKRDSPQTTWNGLWATTVCSMLLLLLSTGLASWCNRVIHLLRTTSGFSAGFEGLSIALVSFLWHLSFTDCIRNSIQIIFTLLDHLCTCAHRQYCLLLFIFHSICHDYAPVGLGLSET